MTTRVNHMMLDRVDSRDHVVGRVQRGRIFDEKANFRVVHIIVRNRHDQILLQKIAPGLRHEGEWGSSAAGYVKAGETYRQAAARKLKAELGLIADLKSHNRTSMLDEGCRKFIGVFTARYDGVLRLVPEHVAGIEFLSLDEISEAVTGGARSFTATFLNVMRYLEPHVFRRARTS